MKRKCWLLLLVFVVLLNIGSAMSDDGFYVVAVGGGVGTKITSLPYTINSPGFYYVIGNLTCASGHGITVNANDVTIDLMGFCLSGNSGSGESIAILSQDHSNLEVRNGTLRGWKTCGVLASSVEMGSDSTKVINVRCQNNNYLNISLVGANSLVRGCTIYGGDTGIAASLVENNVVSNCSSNGITGASGYSNRISGNVVSNCSTGINVIGSIIGNVVNNCGTGINCIGSIIGNTVSCDIGQTGINISNVFPVMMDQNTVIGAGTHYSGGSSATVWAGKSATYPYGNNAGAPLPSP
jgi:hypothetical protein